MDLPLSLSMITVSHLLHCPLNTASREDTTTRTNTLQRAISVNASCGQFLCLFDFIVQPSLPCDIVLGRDWFLFCYTALVLL